jgi:hypothetical protein
MSLQLFQDRYIVSDRTIGHGAHAVVFLATEVETGQHVVCKVHNIGRFSQASRELKRVRQEAALLSTLDHVWEVLSLVVGPTPLTYPAKHPPHQGGVRDAADNVGERPSPCSKPPR